VKCLAFINEGYNGLPPLLLFLLIVVIIYALCAVVGYYRTFKCPICKRRSTPRWDRQTKNGWPDGRYKFNALRCTSCGQTLEERTRSSSQRRYVTGTAISQVEPRENWASSSTNSVPDTAPPNICEAEHENASLSIETGREVQGRGEIVGHPGELAVECANAQADSCLESFDPAKKGGQRDCDDAASTSPESCAEAVITTRAAVPETEVSHIHRQVQLEIFECLTDECLNEPWLSDRSVTMEVSGMDILVTDRESSAIIEIKIGDNIIRVIRQAIGQLLEYHYFCEEVTGEYVRLVIVSTLEMDEVAREYLRFLRRTYGIKITYIRYIPGSYKFTL
jgi:transcription elongation factor Elf1